MISEIKYLTKQIIEKRNLVRQQLIKKSQNINSGTISQISTVDLRLLFDLYDQVFFNGYFANNLRGTLVFSLSEKMTKAAGKTIIPRNISQLRQEDISYEIRMGVNFFFKYYTLSRDKVVCGIKSKDSLEAFQLVFEHELCHMIEYHDYKSSSCKQQRFKEIAGRIFGHTDTYHQLPTDREIASEVYGFKVGDKITFKFENKQLYGIISRINKRATVMVPDNNGMYADGEGNRYTKYYVPLGVLNKY